ncbi:hypothetical protein TSAR_002411 [Trichomalopsis sarcophagae]|uniref:Odorant receptor n=1 Tax=Trichomalopsis sarcophagae TaxID=543379 RepID=A0A232EU56_9HYME|nr:hypothetical protein TSAR_002411 [Trichomalopsis sarcophagae]
MVLNLIKPLNESRPWDFIMHGEFPVNDMYAHYGEIYLFDSLACIATVLVFCTVDSMYATCIEHCIGLFAIVKCVFICFYENSCMSDKIRITTTDRRSRLELSTKFVNREGVLGIKRDDMVYDLIVKTIKLHKKIINFTHILESSYSTSFLILMGMNMLYCSLVSVLLIIKSDALMERIRYGTILLGLLIHLFYISWPGQKIIDLSTGLFEDAYSNEWYETSIRSQNLLKFMRLRCLTPCQLTAGGIYVMNFANFASWSSVQRRAPDRASTSYVHLFRLVGLMPFEARSFDFLGTRLLTVNFVLFVGLDCSMFICYTINHLKQQETSCRGIEKKIRMLFKCLFSTTMLNIIFYFMKMLTTRLPPLEPGGPERKVLLFKYYVDEVSTSPAYELVVTLQTAVCYNFAIVLLVQDIFVPLLIMISCGYLRVVQNRLLNIYELDSKDDALDDSIDDCYKFHQSTLDMCLKIKKLSPTLYLVHILCTGYVLSLFGLKFSTSKSSNSDRLKSLSSMMMLVVQLYIYQWAPDQLIRESEAVSTAAYFANLPRIGSPGNRKILSIVMQRAHKPVILTAAGFVRLSIESFGSMITSAVSFFAALRSISIRDEEQ